MEIQGRDLFVWLETLTPAMSVCFRNWFYIADIIGSNVYVCIYTYIFTCLYIHMHVFMDVYGYTYLLKAHKLNNEKRPKL